MSQIRPVSAAVPEAEEPCPPHDAAERLFRKHGEWLRKRLSQRLGPDLADDIVQDTWTRLVGRNDLASLERPRPFLVRIVANLLIDRRRRSAVRPSCVELDSLPYQLSVGEDQTQTVLLKQIVMSMPQALQTVFVLSRFGGWTYQYLESGAGRVDLQKLAMFAERMNADPYAILLAAQFGSSRFAVRAADNKAAMVVVMALEQFDADAADRITQLDAATLLSAVSGAFRALLSELDNRDAPLGRRSEEM